MVVVHNEGKKCCPLNLRGVVLVNVNENSRVKVDKMGKFYDPRIW